MPQLNDAHILVVDDEPQIRRTLRTALASCGYTISEAASGEEALQKLPKLRPDLVLLDFNLPGMSGVETCREIRAASSAGIIMVTVRNAEHDKVLALDAGADDYITKPFGIEELLARIRAALRRTAAAEDSPSFSARDLSVDFERREVIARGHTARLTPKEFELFRVLATNPGKPLTHRRLLQSVWGPGYGDEIEYLRVFINQLRKKIEADTANPRFILTEPWVGYRFELPSDARFTLDKP